jgi:MFS family permease
MLATLPGFLLVGLTHSTGQLYLGLLFLACGSACVMPSLSALVSRYSPPERQGLALGIFRSLGSLARVIGPLAGGLLFFTLGSPAPYWAAAVVLLLPLALTRALPPVPAA